MPQIGFGLKRELKSTLIGWGFCTLIELPMFLIPGINTKWVSYWYTPFVFLVANFAIYVPSTIAPLWQSYKFSRHQKETATAMSKVTRLQELLAIPQGFEIFLTFCLQEFASEGNYLERPFSSLGGYCIVIYDPCASF
jgi:hypothetical protein